MTRSQPDPPAPGSGPPARRMPKPFGPGSLLWQHFDTRLAYLIGPAFGILQNMYPALGAGVAEHSDVYDGPWSRLTRSLPEIVGSIYDGPAAAATAERIRRYHEPITGIDDQGRRYHALDPDTFFWAHATFVQAIYIGTDLLGTPLNTAQRHQLYAESIDWYAMYGLSMRPVPPDYDAFQAYWNHTCEHVLEATPAAKGILVILDHLDEHPYPGVPKPLWRVAATAGRRPFQWLQHGVLPAPARARLGINWSERDEVALRTLGAMSGKVWPHLPARVRLITRAYNAKNRSQLHPAGAGSNL
jgi:uncharacterized protein (DUF2236 family)